MNRQEKFTFRSCENRSNRNIKRRKKIAVVSTSMEFHDPESSHFIHSAFILFLHSFNRCKPCLLFDFVHSKSFDWINTLCNAEQQQFVREKKYRETIHMYALWKEERRYCSWHTLIALYVVRYGLLVSQVAHRANLQYVSCVQLLNLTFNWIRLFKTARHLHFKFEFIEKH